MKQHCTERKAGAIKAWQIRGEPILQGCGFRKIDRSVGSPCPSR